MKRDWRDFKAIYGGFEGARANFEEACETLIRKMYPNQNVQIVRASHGDEGIDILVGNIGIESIKVFQCKFFLDQIGDAQKAQIRKSFNTAIETSKYKMYEWTLCIPKTLDIDENKWWSGWKEKNRKKCHLHISLKNGNELISLMQKYNIYSQIFHVDNAIKIDEIHKTLVKETDIKRIKEKKYLQPENYLKRKVIPTEKISDYSLYFRDEFSKDITKEIMIYKRIVLLGDAGIGKSTELKRIANYFSQYDKPLYPIFTSLNNYVNQNLVEYLHLPKEWKTYPENQLLIILDGFDEIESKHKNDSIRSIQWFSDNYPSSHIIISCRTNFYKKESKQTSGTLKDFISYILLDLDYKQIEKYINDELDKNESKFKKIILKNKIYDLLKIPFYLINLVELFKKKGTLPKTKADIFEYLINSRINFDEEHFRTTIPEELEYERKTIIMTLQKLSLGMEMLCRNYITDDEYKQFIPDKYLRKLLQYCSIWKLNTSNSNWQFEHNNFQEYLAAKSLSKLPIGTIKELISFPLECKKIVPSWINAISFLFSILYKKSELFKELLKWIINIQPEILINLEPDKIDETTRIQIFKNIFNHYKKNKIWINRERFNIRDLAHFGQSEKVIEFLFNEVEKVKDNTILGNSINILNYSEILKTDKRKKASNILLDLVSNNNDNYIKSSAMISLSNLKLDSKECVDKIVEKHRNSNNDWIRYGLYYLLHNSDYLDQYIDVFLEGIKYSRRFIKAEFGSNDKKDTVRLADELWNLKIGLKKAKTPRSLRKIINYFKENPEVIRDIYFEKEFVEIVENLIEGYYKDQTIWEDIKDCFIILTQKYYDEICKDLKTFFIETKTNLKLFKLIFENYEDGRDKLLLLATIADNKAIEYFVEQYEQHKLTDNDITIFRNYLSFKNNELYLPFNELINERYNNRFLLPPLHDFEKERKERKQKDIQLLFNKDEFINEIKLIFEKEQKKSFTQNELYQFDAKNWNNKYYSEMVYNTMLDLARNKTISLKSVIEEINNWSWDLFTIDKLFRKMYNGEKFTLTPTQIDWIKDWCNANVKKVNFKTAIKKTSDCKISTEGLAFCLWYFMRRFNFTYPKNVLLDMISFDLPEKFQYIGIAYLENLLPEYEMKERVLENLKEGIEVEQVLINHIYFCRKHKMKEILPFCYNLIKATNLNKDYSNELKKVSLQTILDISEDLKELENALCAIKDSFKWEIVEKLLEQKSDYVYQYLLNILQNGSDKEKYIASEYLIDLQDLNGLKYYVNWIKKNKVFKLKHFEKTPLTNLRIIEAVPYLIELLEISYSEKENLKQDIFYKLDYFVKDTLSLIALESEENYIKVKNSTEKFIKENHNIEDINYLYIFLENLDKKFYVNKSASFDIKYVIKKINELNIS